MRLLVVAPYPPTPPFAGGRRRIFEQLRALSRSNEVDLACLTYSRSDARHLSRMPHVRRFVAIPHEPIRGDLTDSFWSPRLAAEIARMCRSGSYDWMLIEHSYAARYAEACTPRTKLALTLHNVEYRLLEQLAAAEERVQRVLFFCGPAGEMYRHAAAQLPAVREFEQAAWRDADLCLVVSPAEQRLVTAVTSPDRALMAPNCACVDEGRPGSAGPQRVVFIGALNYVPNVDAVMTLAADIAPRVRGRLPRVDVLAAGREPHPSLVRLCRAAGVRVVANPARICAVCNESTILVSLLRFGAGTRIKLLDAMAVGLPVVASPLAAEGLDVEDGRELLLASTVDEACDAACALLESQDLRARLRRAGRQFLRRHRLTWPRVFADVETRLQAAPRRPVAVRYRATTRR